MALKKYNLVEHVAALAALAVSTQFECRKFKVEVSEYFSHCTTIKQATDLVTAVYKAHTKSAGTKQEKAADFAASRTAINRLLASGEYAFNKNKKLSAKVKGNTCSITAIAKAKGGKAANQNNSTNSAGGNRYENITEKSKFLAKLAGSEFDDRIFALKQSMSSLELNVEDTIIELFSGLLPIAQADCILKLQASAKPVTPAKPSVKAA